MKLEESGRVLSEGSILLAFIAVCESNDFLWSVRQQSDKTYTVQVLATDDMRFIGRGDTLEQAIKEISDSIIDIAMREAAKA